MELIYEYQNRKNFVVFHVNFCFLILSFWGFSIMLFLICLFCHFITPIGIDYQCVTSNQQDFKKKIMKKVSNDMRWFVDQLRMAEGILVLNLLFAFIFYLFERFIPNLTPLSQTKLFLCRYSGIPSIRSPVRRVKLE